MDNNSKDSPASDTLAPSAEVGLNDEYHITIVRERVRTY